MVRDTSFYVGESNILKSSSWCEGEDPVTSQSGTLSLGLGRAPNTRDRLRTYTHGHRAYCSHFEGQMLHVAMEVSVR